MANDRSLRYCYERYKPATESILTSLFHPDSGRDKICKKIENRVKKLKSKKRVLDQVFFLQLRRAIFWRKRAAEKFDSLQARSDEDEGHSYFVRLLAWIDKHLSPISNSVDKDKVTEVCTGNVFNFISREHGDNNCEATTDGLNNVYTESHKPKSPDDNPTLLQSDSLTITLTLLEDLRLIMAYAQNMCNNLHNGKLDHTTASILITVIHTEIKSLCSRTALLIDKWSELNTWVDRATWEEFGLENFYDSFKWLKLLYPDLERFQSKLKDGDDTYDLNPVEVARSNYRLHSGMPIPNKATRKDKTPVLPPNKFTDEQWNSFFADKMPQFGEDHITVQELVADRFKYRQASQEAKYHSLSYLGATLGSLIRRRRFHEQSMARGQKVVQLIENPMVVDLFDFLFGQTRLATISIMMGIGLLDMFMQKPLPKEQVVAVALAKNIHNLRLECLDTVQSQFESSSQILLHGDQLEPSAYPPFFQTTDTITLGLSHAQLTPKFHKYTLSWMCSSESRLDLFDIVSLAKYLENKAQPSSAPSPVRLLCQRIAKLYDFTSDATTLQYHDNLRRQWKQRPLKIPQRPFNKILDNPNLSLINSLLDKNFSLSKSWLLKSQDCTWVVSYTPSR